MACRLFGTRPLHERIMLSQGQLQCWTSAQFIWIVICKMSAILFKHEHVEHGCHCLWQITQNVAQTNVCGYHASHSRNIHRLCSSVPLGMALVFRITIEDPDWLPWHLKRPSCKFRRCEKHWQQHVLLCSKQYTEWRCSTAERNDTMTNSSTKWPSLVNIRDWHFMR